MKRLSPDIWLPKLLMAPSFLITMAFVYGFIIWTALLSFTKSRLMPQWSFVGWEQYIKLLENDRWLLACKNLIIFGGLFIGISTLIGLALAILLDQKIRAEGFLRTIYLYPMALSFIVTGTVWKWILNPSSGIQSWVHELGFTNFSFEWLIEPDMVIYTVVIAGVWQSSGFVMALFLAGLRGIDSNIIKAAQLDGASLPKIYYRLIIPNLRPVFFTVVMILAHIAIKSFDLVMALTGGGPGYASDLPATFMYAHMFSRGQVALGSASSIMMLMGIIAILIPMLWSELRGKA